LATRYRLACKAFRLTAEYDMAIAGYLSRLDPRAVAECYTVKNRGGS
jgi:AICAR transformylase/IMP cyclohydrolase PurH